MVADLFYICLFLLPFLAILCIGAIICDKIEKNDENEEKKHGRV